MRGATVAQREKPKPIPIVHLRLDHEIALRDRDSAEIKRIKAINAFLGARENSLAELKLKGSPMAMLIEKASAKGEELMAAQEIELAWFSLAGSLMFKAPSLEKTSPGVRHDWPRKTIEAVARYQEWANHWSVRKKAHLDYTLPCVISAVIDQRPIRTIADEMGFHHSRIERAVLGGLRDYAARAGWVDGKIAGQWMDAAMNTFKRERVHSSPHSDS